MALTPEQFEKLKNRLGGGSQGFEPKSPTISAPEEGFVSGVKSAIERRGENVAESKGMVEAGRQTTAEGMLQSVGQVAGLAGDVGFEAVKAVTPEFIKEPVAEVAKSIFGSRPVQEVAQQYESWKEANPRAAADIESILNIGSIIPVGKATQLGLKATQAGLKTGVKTADDIIKQGISLGKKSVSPITKKAGDILTPIESGVETVLSKPTTLPKLEKYAKQAEIAVSDYAQKTPLELAGEEAQKAITSIQGQMKSLGETKKAITKQLASTKVDNISKEVVRDLSDNLINNLGIKSTPTGFSKVAGRLSKVSDKADLRLIKEIETKLKQANTFQKLDDAIDYAQDLLFKRGSLTAIPVNTQVQGILKGTIKKANDMLKEVGGDAYKQANIKLSNRIQVFNKLNKALGQEGNKGASLMKQLFSPTGTAPRKLFQAVKDLTGIDLVDEATLAKFVMENVGDARQASLLEEVIRIGRPTPTGLIGKAAEKVITKLQNPIGKAKRISEKAQGL